MSDMEDDPVGKVIFLVVWTGLAAGFFVLGIYFMRNTTKVAEFFRGAGSQMLGRRIANRVYRESGVKAAAIGYLILGPVFVVIGIIGIVRTIMDAI